MVVLAIAGFLGIGVWALMQAQNKTYTVQDNASQMQQNLRAAVDRMSRDLLVAGQGPQTAVTGNTWYTAGNNWQPYWITLNGTPVTTNGTQLDMIGCTTDDGDAGATPTMAQVAAAGVASGAMTIPLAGAPPAGFTVNSYITIGGLEGGKITVVGANSITINRSLTYAYSSGTLVAPVQWITYSVVGGTLMRNKNDGTGNVPLAYYVTLTVSQVNAPNVTGNPPVTAPDGGSVQITLTGQAPGPNGVTYSATNTVHLRNTT